MAISDGGKPPDAFEPALSCRVVDAIAQAKGIPPTDLEPLFGSIDLESLDSLYEHSDVDVQVEFTVQDCAVEIRADGEIRVETVEE